MNAAIDRDFDDHLERVRDFLRIPSVSAYDGDLRSTAAAVCELIEAAGGSAEIAEPGERRPTVIGVIDGPGPTVLRYGMYDVQPPGAGWTRDPFAAEIDDGRIYARGAANSKAALAGSLLAFAGADNPCRQVLLMDGEEELGSPRLAQFCAEHRDELRADWALDFDMHESDDGIGAGGGRLQGPARARAAGRRRRRRALVADRLGPRARLGPDARADRAPGRDPGRERHVDDRRHARGHEPHGRSRQRPRRHRPALRRATATSCSSACAR